MIKWGITEIEGENALYYLWFLVPLWGYHRNPEISKLRRRYRSSYWYIYYSTVCARTMFVRLLLCKQKMSYTYKQLVCHESGACIIIGTDQKEGSELIMILYWENRSKGVMVTLWKQKMTVRGIGVRTTLEVQYKGEMRNSYMKSRHDLGRT